MERLTLAVKCDFWLFGKFVGGVVSEARGRA